MTFEVTLDIPYESTLGQHTHLIVNYAELDSRSPLNDAAYNYAAVGDQLEISLLSVEGNPLIVNHFGVVVGTIGDTYTFTLIDKSDGYSRGAEATTQVVTDSASVVLGPVNISTKNAGVELGPTNITTENAPSVVVPVPKGAITLTGKVPTVAVTGSSNVTIPIPKGTITLAGKVPVVTVVAAGSLVIPIPKGVVTLTGKTPTVSIITPGAVSLTPTDVNNIVDALFNKIMEGGETFAESIRIIRAESAGNMVNSGNVVRFRDASDTKDRISAIVDGSGNRTITLTDGG